ncbi:MAG: hypothetical protein ACP5E4_02135, partial [Candidatus Aenigmatarchaeota archaeon]
QQCKWACPGCEKVVFEGSKCETPEDCITPLTPSEELWDCVEDTAKNEKYCSNIGTFREEP